MKYVSDKVGFSNKSTGQNSERFSGATRAKYKKKTLCIFTHVSAFLKINCRIRIFMHDGEKSVLARATLNGLAGWVVARGLPVCCTPLA